MRHRKRKHLLGRKSAPRSALLAELSSQLLIHGKIKTTLAKAKAVRPYVEKVITLSRKAYQLSDIERLSYYRRAIGKLRSETAAYKLFNEWVGEVLYRDGGYTRIYKLGTRRGDAAEMAIIEIAKNEDIPHKRASARRIRTNREFVDKQSDRILSEQQKEVESSGMLVRTKESHEQKKAAVRLLFKDLEEDSGNGRDSRMVRLGLSLAWRDALDLRIPIEDCTFKVRVAGLGEANGRGGTPWSKESEFSFGELNTTQEKDIFLPIGATGSTEYLVDVLPEGGIPCISRFVTLQNS